MTNKNTTKKALIFSALSLLLCFSMLVGTTFAWFTDSVTSAGNIIQSGTLKLDVELYDAEKQAWNSIKESKDPIFNYNNWEPGYVDVKMIKIENEGSLSFKWAATFTAENELSILADVIDVYVCKSATEITYPTSRELGSEWEKVGTAREFINSINEVVSGVLHSKNDANGNGGVEYVGFALKMQESAGNDYQGLTLGGAFDIQILATQMTYEGDSFDEMYDNAATWIGIIPASLDKTTLEIVPGGGSQTGTITVNSPEDLVYLSKLAKEWVSLYSNGQGTNVGSYRENVGGKGTDYYYHWTWDIKLAADLDMNNVPMDSVDISFWNDFYGNGHTITNVVLKDGQDGLFINGAKAINDLTVKNISVNAPTAQTVGAVSGNGSMTNVHVENATVVGGKYVGGICGKGSSFVNCSIKNSTVTGNDKTVGGLVGYSVGDPNAATVTGNLVENVTVTGAYNVGGLLGQSQNETVEGNTVKDVRLTSNASVPADGDATEVRTGAVAARVYNATVGTNEVINVTDFQPATPDTIQAEIDAAAPGTTIYLAANKFHTTINMKSGITLEGTNGTVVDCINLNGADDIALKNIEFDAAGAKVSYDGKGNAKQYANIISGDANKNGKGTRGILIENCTFAGEFADGGVAIAFADQGRGSGQSGNITVKGCTFKTTGGYYDIYTYYSGYGSFVIEGNTFESDVLGKMIYLGRYQSSTPVVVKGNTFATGAVLDDVASIQAHSGSYTVSFDDAENTFAE
ncbi:MAG: SipW-dependent-type signal peptide-containing protein [Clostridia bacterium]|nr:SipW-dependent-type signal peptide-containing protein [Clostridia bacterium]